MDSPTYTVQHLKTGESFSRPYILYNDRPQTAEWAVTGDSTAEAFHQTLPDYGETPLHSLPSVAAELGFRHVLVKDESMRFGLPSFKILGASWAIHRALCQYLSLDASTSSDELRSALKVRDDVRLVTCTEGNWGRACARVAKYLAVPICIYVPTFMDNHTQALLRDEGANVKLLQGGTYDDTIAAVQADASSGGGLMIMDTSWDGFEEIPKWVTEGYHTMLRETDRQVRAMTGSRTPDLAVVAVGVGSWAHAVVAHYRSCSPHIQIVTVEPEAAPSLKESLHCEEIVPIATGETIMNGMNCGTTSTLAWPVLRAGTDVAVVVSEYETHSAVQSLISHGISAGPCGAAPLAALRKLCADMPLAARRGWVVVLFSTEGRRDYELRRSGTV